MAVPNQVNDIWNDKMSGVDQRHADNASKTFLIIWREIPA